MPFHGKFIGREWLLQELEETVEKSKHGVLIVAEPGFGKSAFLSNIIKGRFQTSNIRKNLLSYHICKYGYDQCEGAVEFILDLISQFRCLYPSYRNFLSSELETSVGDIRNNCRNDPLKCSETYVISPLRNSSIIPRRSTKFIIIDGLDECLTPQIQPDSRMNFIKLFKRKYRTFFPHVKFIATTRNNSMIVSFFQTFKRIDIHSDNDKQVDDLIRYVKKATSCSNLTSQKIVMHANMNMLILTYILSMDIHRCDEYLTRQLPSNLSELYHLELDRIYDGNMMAFKRDKSILEVLVTIELNSIPMTKHLLVKILKYERPMLDDYLVSQTFQKYKAHLIRLVNEDRIEFIHHSFYDWITSPGTLISEYSIDLQNGHRLWAEFLNETLTTAVTNGGNSNRGKQNIFSLLVAFIVHMTRLGDGKLSDSEGEQSFEFIESDAYCEDLIGYIKCLRGVEMFAWKINNFSLMDTIIRLSPSKNITFAAFYATESHHTETFEALLTHGINMSQKMITCDFRYSCNKFTVWRKSTSPSQWKSINETTKNNVICHGKPLPNGTSPDEYDKLSLLHASIIQNFIEGAAMILEMNSSSVFEISERGWDVFDFSVYVGNIEMIKLMMKYRKISKRFWYLYIAILKKKVDMIVFLTTLGIKDSCVCDNDNVSWINDSHFTINIHGSDMVFDMNSSLSLKYLLKFRHEITCESALIMAIKNNLNNIVEHLLRAGKHSLECRDTLGMTPMATAIFHRKEDIIKTLSNLYKVSFIVRSMDYEKRASLINSVFIFPGEGPWIKKHTFDGANIAHLVALRPSCQAVKLLISHCEYSRDKCMSLLKAKDANGFTPLYYSLCHGEADNEYECVADYKYPRSDRMSLLLMWMIAGHGVETDALLELFGICGERVYLYSNLEFLRSKYDVCSKRIFKFETPTFEISVYINSSWTSYIVVTDYRSNERLFEIQFLDVNGKEVIDKYRNCNSEAG